MSAAVVAELNSDWRVIADDNGGRWILQHREDAGTAEPRWRPRRFHRNAEALVMSIRAVAGEVEPQACKVIAALPARFPERDCAA